MPRLSAGRVQSVATRLIVDRERERIAFRSASYWDLDAILDAGPDAQPPFSRSAHSGWRATGGPGPRFRQPRFLDHEGHDQLVLLDEGQAQALRTHCGRPAMRWTASSPSPTAAGHMHPSARRRCSRRPAASSGSLRSARCRSLKICTRRGSLPTCEPTRSPSPAARSRRPRDQVRQLFGPDYLPDRPRLYTSKVKNAQEAHEAIRPAGETFLTPAQTGMTGDQFRLRADLDAHDRLTDEGCRGYR